MPTYTSPPKNAPLIKQSPSNPRNGGMESFQNRVFNPGTSVPLPNYGLHEGRSGQPLDAATRGFMESRFNQDFSGVRVHSDASAAQSAEQAEALAYTVGRDVVFGPGQYQPATAAGRKLIAHELTHVVQQNQLASSDGASSVTSVTGLPAESEAAASARSVAGGGQAQVRQASPRSLQRQPKRNTLPPFLPPQLLEDLKKMGLATDTPEGPVIASNVDPKLVAAALDTLKTGKAPRQAAQPTFLNFPFPAPGANAAEPSAAQPVFPGSPFVWSPLITNVVNQPTQKQSPPKKTQPSLGANPQQTQADQLANWAQEIGRIDLEQGDRLSFPALGKKPSDPYLAAQEAGIKKALREVTRKQIESGMSLVASVSRAHFGSTEELNRFMDEYVEIAGEISPEKGKIAAAERATIDSAIINAQTDMLYKQAKIEEARPIVEGQIGHMRIATPEFVKPAMAMGEKFAIPLIKTVDPLLDFVPYVGMVKLLLEGISGRTISGQLDLAIETGLPLDQLPPDLQLEDRVIRVIPFAIESAVKIIGKVPGWIEAFTKLKTMTKMGDTEFIAVLKDISKLQGKEKQVIEALLKLRQARRAVARGAKRAALAPAFMFTGAGGIGGVASATGKAAAATTDAEKGVELVLEVEGGLDANDVRRKAEALNDLCTRREVTKVKSPVRKLVSGGAGEPYRGMPVSVQSEYKFRLLDIAHKRFGPESPNYDPQRWKKFFDLWKSKSGDHVQDLQLSGADDIGNIWLFDAETNVALGRQIQSQLRNLPDGTRITGVKWRIKGPPD